MKISLKIINIYNTQEMHYHSYLNLWWSFWHAKLKICCSIFPQTSFREHIISNFEDHWLKIQAPGPFFLNSIGLKECTIISIMHVSHWKIQLIMMEWEAMCCESPGSTFLFWLMERCVLMGKSMRLLACCSETQ